MIQFLFSQVSFLGLLEVKTKFPQEKETFEDNWSRL